MSLSKSKCWCLNNCSHFLKLAVPFFLAKNFGAFKLFWQSVKLSQKVCPWHVSESLTWYWQGRPGNPCWRGRISVGREVLLKGKSQYGWPPCINQFRSAPFYIENIINLFYNTKQATLMRRSTVLSLPPPLVCIPWCWWPPCTYLFGSAAFQTETKVFSFTKQPILIQTSTILMPPL